MTQHDQRVALRRSGRDGRALDGEELALAELKIEGAERTRDRTAVVTSPEFAALHERALRALRGER